MSKKHVVVVFVFAVLAAGCQTSSETATSVPPPPPPPKQLTEAEKHAQAKRKKAAKLEAARQAKQEAQRAKRAARQARLEAEKRERQAREEAERQAALAREREPKWRDVRVFKGSSIKNTESFDIQGEEWRINWKTKPGEYGAMNFQIFVYNADGSLKDLVANIIGEGEDSSVIRGAGRYYLQFNTAQPYAVLVQEYR